MQNLILISYQLMNMNDELQLIIGLHIIVILMFNYYFNENLQFLNFFTFIYRFLPCDFYLIMSFLMVHYSNTILKFLLKLYFCVFYMLLNGM